MTTNLYVGIFKHTTTLHIDGSFVNLQYKYYDYEKKYI